MLMQIIVILSWLALPATVICVVDDLFLRPRREVRASPNPARDPVFMSVLYHALPIFIGASVLRLLLAERLDFSLVLFSITVVTGVVWALDAFLLRRLRASAAKRAGKDPQTLSEPGTVDYARSFFPVALIVLVLRSFVFEPFRIPSDSMMPTLLDGDFIIVSKFSYGLRMPVLNTKILHTGEPKRGDVVVFRYPPDPTINYIKRLVGLPGDHIEVVNDRLIVNGEPAPFEVVSVYNDGCYVNLQLAQEQLGEHTHHAMSCPAGRLDSTPEPPVGCKRSEVRGYFCGDQQMLGVYQQEDRVFDVPAGHYLMIGDNRDNSADSREWGYVPENNLVGKATRIWFNWDLQRSGGPAWSRIGKRIE